MNHKRVLAAATAVAALAAAVITPNAQAGQIGFYIGGQYGQADKSIDIQGFDIYANNVVFASPNIQLSVDSFTSSLDKSDSGYGFFAGYRFTPHLAVEGGYVDMGSLKYRSQATGNITGIPTNAVLNVDSDTSGIAVSALGIWPMSYRWEIYGRGGVLFASNNFQAYYADVVGPRGDEYSENSVDLMAGIGTSFTVLEIYDLRLEFQRVFDAGDDTTGEGDVDMLSLGITVVF